MTDYSKYIFEVYGLTEMPVRLHNIDWTLNDSNLNQREADRVLKTGKNLGNYKISAINFRFYNEEEDGVISYYLIDTNNPYIHAEFSFNRISIPISGIESVSIWNCKYNKGLVRYFIEDYILKQERVLISDKSQTARGFNFWQALFDDCVDGSKTHKMYIIDFKTGNVICNIHNKNEMKEYFGELDKTKFRFVLEKI